MKALTGVSSVVAILALGMIAATPAPAMALRLTCRDGLPAIAGAPNGQAFCNHDEPQDGVCTFAICSTCPFTRGCVGPESGVCPDGDLPPGAEVVTVPVKRRAVRRIGTTRVVFRCRVPIPCDAKHRCSSVTRTCDDGVLVPGGEGECDIDEKADGACTFGFYCWEVCGPLVGTVTVPVGEARTVERGNLPGLGVTKYTLRCRPAQ